jgi:nucleoside-diphosphate-sugar epimerase
MKKVLLTGASGFIGHHCITPLLELGYDVHAVSSRQSSLLQPGVTWHQTDLLDPQQSASLVERIKPTHLLHLAWYVVPGKLITARENFAWVSASFELLLQFAKQNGTRVVMSGSCYEYDWSYGYCSETLTPRTPNTAYGSCKAALAELLSAFAVSAELSSAWGRAFFLYGPNEHPDRLVPSVIRSLLAGEPARCSHGRQIRDYMHVQDVADGLVALLDSEVTGAVNIASGQAITLKQIVTSIGRQLQREDLILLGAIPARANDAPLVVGDNARLQHEVGWQQTYDLESGLEHTIRWWADHLSDGGVR